MRDLVLVPLEPTDGMLLAYSGALKKLVASEPNPEVRWPIKGRHSGYKVREQEKAVARWKAMVEAAQAEQTQGV